MFRFIRKYRKAEKGCEKLDSVTLKGVFTLMRTEKGVTPYRRPPYSLVADNFIVTGGRREAYFGKNNLCRGFGRLFGNCA